MHYLVELCPPELASTHQPVGYVPRAHSMHNETVNSQRERRARRTKVDQLEAFLEDESQNDANEIWAHEVVAVVEHDV